MLDTVYISEINYISLVDSATMTGCHYANRFFILGLVVTVGINCGTFIILDHC